MNKEPGFYNTIHLEGNELQEAQESNEKQTAKVLAFFIKHKHLNFTPYEVHKHLKTNAPITSIRRAITDLTEQNKLIKTNIQRKGKFNKPNYCWTLAENMKTYTPKSRKLTDKERLQHFYEAITRNNKLFIPIEDIMNKYHKILEL